MRRLSPPLEGQPIRSGLPPRQRYGIGDLMLMLISAAGPIIVAIGFTLFFYGLCRLGGLIP